MQCKKEENRTHWLVEVVSHRISKSSNCIVQNEQVFVLQGEMLIDSFSVFLVNVYSRDEQVRQFHTSISSRPSELREQRTDLVFSERVDEGLEDEGEVGHELGARLLLERRERRARRLLHPLVGVQDSLQQLCGHNTHCSSNQV